MANRSSNRAAIPEAKSALDRFKYEVASEIGVPLRTATTEILPPDRMVLSAVIWSRK